MGALADQINARLTDIDTAIAAEQASSLARIAALQREKDTWLQTLPLLTDRLEAVVVTLTKLGLIRSF